VTVPVAALEWDKVLVAAITALSLAFGRWLWFTLRKQSQTVAVEDADIQRDRKLSEGWAEYASYMEGRLKLADAKVDKLQRSLADCERGLKAGSDE
jgi:hypothetical protein